MYVCRHTYAAPISALRLSACDGLEIIFRQICVQYFLAIAGSRINVFPVDERMYTQCTNALYIQV